MTEERLISVAVATCGILATTTSALIVYIFIQQKATIAKIEDVLSGIVTHTVKKSDCHRSVDDISQRVGDLEDRVEDIAIRITVVETRCGVQHADRH